MPHFLQRLKFYVITCSHPVASLVVYGWTKAPCRQVWSTQLSASECQ